MSDFITGLLVLAGATGTAAWVTTKRQQGREQEAHAEAASAAGAPVAEER